MPLVRRIRKRGANIVVEAHGEVLFAATGDVGRWQNRFSHRVRTFAAQEAPTNKRPRWGHYGKPLKSTFTASTTYQPGRMRVYSAIGSSAPHAWYVDQGTGIYNGSSPWKAKILPPWQRGEGSLYEHTWRPAGPGRRRVKPVYIKGQKGQGFFDKGLVRGFRSMRMRSVQVPGEGGPKISNVLNSIPTGMTNFAGNTASDGAFVAQLQEWRKWRDDSWARNILGRRVRPERDPNPKPSPSKPTTDPNKAANLAAYRASVEAAKRRAAAQAAKLKAQREAAERKRERERMAAEAERLRIGNAKMKREANAFYAKIRVQYPDATIASTTLPDGVVVYRVSYVVDGEIVRQQWAYGYAT